MSLDSGRSSAQPGSQISKSKGVLRWRNERTSAVATDSTRQIFRVMVVEQGRAGINQNKLRRTAAKGRRESTLCERLLETMDTMHGPVIRPALAMPHFLTSER